MRKPMAKAQIQSQNPNSPGAESFESGGSSSSGTRAWMAFDACEEGFSGGSGSGSDGGPVDCDPGSLRLRSLLQAADRALSPSGSGSFTSSCCDGESESESGDKESREDKGPPRFVARAASARRFMDRARASPADSSIAAVGGDAGGGDKAGATAADQDADVESAEALAAALEAVLLCPPQVLARSTSCQGQCSFLASLLMPTSEPSPSDRGDDHPCSRGGACGGDGEEDDEAAEDAVKAALAWSFPVPNLPSVVEEAGQECESKDRRTVSKEWDIVTFSAPGSRSNAMPESAEAAAAEGGCCASDSAVVLAGYREGFAVNDDKARRRASATSSSSGEPDADTLPPSPMLTGQLSARTPSNVCSAAETSPAAAASSEAAAADGRDSRSSDECLAVTPTESGRGLGFAPCDISRERSTTQGGLVYTKTAADDDDSGSVEDTGGTDGGGGGGGRKPRRSSFGNAASWASTDRRGHQRSRWGSMNMGEFSPEDAPPSATALAQEREKLLLSVFGRHAGAAELATVGRSNSCHVFLEAAGRITALPPLERSLLTELDRSSDDEGGGGDSDCGVDGYGDVASRLRAMEIAPSPEGTAAASVVSRGPPLLRVGCGEAEAGRNAAPTTAYRYRRLAGNSRRGWPPQVDPMRREEWLCPIEFDAVFGMKFAEFRELPSWKRILLKQEVHLF